jgi:hypothetical protein
MTSIGPAAPIAEQATRRFRRLVGRYATEIGLLLSEEDAWVHRRVEHIEFLSIVRVRRAMSIDFTYPDIPAIRGRATKPAGYIPLLPLALPRKRVLDALDVRDEAGRAVPVLTRSENSFIAYELLTRLALEVVGTAGFSTLDPAVGRDLAGITGYEGVDAPDPDRALFHFVRAHYRPPTRPSDALAQRRLLWNDDVMRPLLWLFFERFLLLVPLDVKPGQRRIIKLAFEDEAEPPPFSGTLLTQIRQRIARLGRALLVSFGWARLRIRIGVRALVGAESYHVEMVGVPAPLKIVRAVLGVSVERYFFTASRYNIATRELDEDRRGDGSHLYASRVRRQMVEEEMMDPASPDEERVATGYAEVVLLLKPRELLAPLFLALLTTAVLVGGLVLHARSHRPELDASTAILVLVPGLISAYRIPAEHPLVRRVFRGLLLPVGVCAAASFAAAASLAVDLSTHERVTLWHWLAWLAAAATASIGIAFLRSLID